MTDLPAARVNSFFRFMVERESIRLRRLLGLPREEWTNDAILQKFKFTNVKRANDRTTRLLMNDFYGPNAGATAGQKLINCTLARFFGTIETMREIGWSEAWNARRKKHVRTTIEAMMKNRRQVFTGAYIVPNCGEIKPKHLVVLDVVDAVAAYVKERGDSEPRSTDAWQTLCEGLQTLRGVGPFMSKEVVLDYILATGWEPYDWNTWTPIGPGACRGAGRIIHGELVKLGEAEALKITRMLHEKAQSHTYWPLSVHVGKRSMVLERLCLTDVQFQLCEFDKYERVQRGEGRPRSLFEPTVESAT